MCVYVYLFRKRISPVTHLLGLRLLIPQGYGCLSLVNVCCQIEVSVTGRSLVQRRPTECVLECVCVDVCECVRERESECVCACGCFECVCGVCVCVIDVTVIPYTYTE